MSAVGELACTYACLILSDDGIPITTDKIVAIVKAAKVPVESYWPSLFAKLAEKKDIEDLILNIDASGGAVAVAAPAAGGTAVSAATPPPIEEKKEEPEEESDDDMVCCLFD